MANLGNLLDLDPDLVLKSAQAGRLLIENTFRAAGMSPSEAADEADRIIANVGDFLGDGPDLDDAAAEHLLERINPRLAEIGQLSEETRSFVAQAAMLSSGAAFSAQDSRTKSRWAAIALLVFANIDPHFTVRSDGTWEVGNQPLVIEVVNRVLGSVDEAIKAWKEVELSRSGAAQGAVTQPHEEQHSPGSPLNPSGHEEPAVAVPPHSASGVTIITASELTESNRIENTINNILGPIVTEVEQSRVDLGNGNFGVLDRQFATLLQARALVALNQLAETIRLDPAGAKSVFKEHGKTWNREAPLTFDVGLLPTYRHEQEDVAYRLAVRVQSPGMFKPARWKTLHHDIGLALRGVASIRAMREVRTLAGAPRGGVKHGDSISTRNGPRGSIGCVVLETATNRYLLVTVGHVVGAPGNPAPVAGVHAYSPAHPQPDDQPIGKVVFADLITRSWRAAGVVGSAPERDIAAIAVSEPTSIARPEERRREKLRGLQAKTYQVTDQDVINKAAILKGRGMTPAIEGRIQNLGISVNITYSDTLRTVCATGLVEVMVDRPARPGDSGAPCFDEAGCLIGLVVAGSDRVWTNMALTMGSPLVYVQPVHEIFIQRGWEIF